MAVHNAAISLQKSVLKIRARFVENINKLILYLGSMLVYLGAMLANNIYRSPT